MALQFVVFPLLGVAKIIKTQWIVIVLMKAPLSRAVHSQEYYNSPVYSTVIQTSNQSLHKKILQSYLF